MSVRTVLKQVFAKRNALKYYRIIVQFIDGVKKHLHMVFILHVISADTRDCIYFFERARGRGRES